MVDCRLCTKEYTIYKADYDGEKKLYVCTAKEIIINPEYVSNGPCDLYVDVDSDIPRNGDL